MEEFLAEIGLGIFFIGFVYAIFMFLVPFFVFGVYKWTKKVHNEITTLNATMLRIEKWIAFMGQQKQNEK